MEGVVVWEFWNNDSIDENAYAIGNCFKTKEDAEFEAERLKVIAELKRFAKERFEAENFNYYIYYDTVNDEVWCNTVVQDITANIHFESEEIAEQAIKTVGADRIKKYYFRIEE